MAFKDSNGPFGQPIDELEKKIITLQHSTQTLMPIFTCLHDKLRMGNKWYYNWHLKPNSAKIHKAIAVVYTLGMLLTFVNLTLYYDVQKVTAAAYTWDGGGLTNDWSDCDNWSTNVCPTSADTVTFNATSTKDSTVDASFGGVVTSVTITTGYSGTVTLGRSLQTTSTFTQSTGTFTAANHVLDVDSTFSLTGGVFTAPSTTMTAAANFSITGSPTFNHNSGTITIDGASGTLTCTGVTFNLVAFNHSSTKTIGSSCTLPLGSNPTLAGSGTVTNNGTLSGSGTFTKAAGTLTMNSGASLSGFTGLSLVTFTIAGATIDLGTYSTVAISSTTTVSSGTLSTPSDFSFSAGFVLSGGTFNAPAGSVTFNSTFTASSGTFNHNNGTVIFSGATSATLTCTIATFNAVSFTHPSNTKTISSSCNLPLGASPTVTGPISVTGTLTGTGTLTVNSTMIMNSGGALSGFSGLVVASTFTLAGATLDLGAYSTVDLNGAYTHTSGTFTAPSGTMTIASNITYTAGTFNHNNGIVVLDGASGTINCGTMTFNLVQLTYTSTKTVSTGCTLPLGANPTLPSSVVLSGTLSGTGILTLAANTLTANSGAAISGFNGFSKGAGTGSLVISGANLDFSAYTSTIFNGFTVNSGSFIAPSSTMSTTSFTSNGGTFNANGGTVDFPINGTATCTGGVTFNRVTITHSTSTRTFVNCTVPLGANPASFYQTTLTNSTLTGSDTLTIHGALTLNTGSGITGFSNFVANNGVVVSGGTADFSNFTSVDLNNNLTLSSGTFTAPATGLFTVGLGLTYTGGTFNANGGTMTVDGSGTLTCNNVTFNLVVLTTTRTLTNCTMPLGNNPTAVGNYILNDSTLSGTGTLNIGAVTSNSGTAFSGFSGLTMSGALTIQGGTADLSGMTNADINSSITLSSGTLLAPSGTLFVNSNLTATSGTFTHTNGTIVFDGSSSTLACGNVTFNVVRIESTGTKTINGDCTLPMGTNPTITGAIINSGVISGSGQLTITGVTTLSNSGRISGFSNLSVNSNLTMQLQSDSTADFSTYDTVSISGVLTITSGTFSAPKVLNVGNHFTRTDGVFTHNNGTVNFTGRDQTISGSNTFYNFSKVQTATAAILSIAANTTQTVLNEATLHGFSSSLRLIILATPSTERWNFDPQGARNFKNLDFRQTDNVNAKKINLADTGSFYRNTNTGFVWFTPTVSTLGPTNLVNGSTTNATAPSLTFTTADQDSGDTVSYQIQIDDTPDFSSVLLDYSSPLAVPTASTYTVGQAGTYTTGTVGQKLTNGSYYWRVRAIDNNGSISAWVTATASSAAFIVQSSVLTSDTTTPTATSTPAATGQTILVALRVSILADDGTPAAGANVTLYSEPRHAIADTEGIAHFSDVPTGEHTLKIVYNGKVGEKKIVVNAEPENFATVTTAAVPVELTVQLNETKPMKYYLWLIPTMIALLVIIILLILRLVHFKKYHSYDQIEA